MSRASVTRRRRPAPNESAFCWAIKDLIRTISGRRAGVVFMLGLILVVVLGFFYSSSIAKALLSVPVDSSNPLHMFYLFLALLSLGIPLPIPAIMLSLCIIGGFYFKLRVFFVLLPAFFVTIPLGFSIGRLFQSRYGPLDEWGDLFFTCCIEQYARYAIALRRAFEGNPIKLCFLWMWTPLPAQLEPFLLGAGTKISIRTLMMAGYPSKILQASLMAGIGMQTSSLAEALDQGVKKSPLDIALFVLGIALTVALMLVLGYMFKKELRRIQESRQRTSGSLGNNRRAVELKEMEISDVSHRNSNGPPLSDGNSNRICTPPVASPLSSASPPPRLESGLLRAEGSSGRDMESADSSEGKKCNRQQGQFNVYC